jgi:hypothetical protein
VINAYDLDGLFESPHDSPPRWAFMLTAYLDESVESPHGYTVMAGFLGNESQWKVFTEKWKSALRPKRHLHMRKLRWNGDRHKRMLEDLAAVPYECGLLSMYSSVKVSEYEDKIPKFKTKAFAKGYFVTLVGLAASVLHAIPKNERVEFVFEEQREFAAVREHALGIIATSPVLRRKQGNSALAKWSSVPKSSLLEPSDYLAYAVMQNLVDPKSIRSRLCLPILVGTSIGGQMNLDAVSKILEMK